MKIEEELRENGFDWDNVHRCFCWYNLSKDFIRELVEADPIFKTQLEHELLMDIHGYSVHASFFYQNMGYYIQNGLAEQRQLVHYVDKLYQMYREQAEREYNAGRQVYNFTDYNGRIFEQVII